MGIFSREDSTPVPIAPYSTPRALTAAAAQISLKDPREAELFRKRRNSATTIWQNEAWEYYDAIGEIKYAFNLVANIVSRIRLYVAVIDDPAEAPVSIKNSTTVDPDMADAAVRVLARLDSAFGGQAGLLRDISLNLSVTGECTLVQMPERYSLGLPESWDIRSVDEFKVNQDNQYIITPRRDMTPQSGTGANAGIILPPNTFAGRIWRPHPRYSEEPDSSMLGILSLCEELLLLDRTFRASERSRLNAGALLLPDGLANAAAGDPNVPFDDEGLVITQTPEEIEDVFEEQLYEAMITPIANEASASAVVPLLIRGPNDLLTGIKHLTFERPFDSSNVARADRVLERILQGLDVPKDVVTGLASVKYSNAVQIDESLYKAHIEPMLLLISDALTNMYLRPALKTAGYAEADLKRIIVWYDPSSVATRNDRAADADSGYEKNAINSDTWRRAHGFSDSDAPSATELVLRLVTEKGSLTPELTEALLTAFAPDIMAATKVAAQNANVAPVPPEVQNALDGQQGIPAEAPAEAVPAEADPGAVVAPPEEPVAPGEDAPPFPLAEPSA